MINAHILDGDLVVFDADREPQPGKVVAALIDGESTLKWYARKRGRPYLRAANPRYKDIVPAHELLIQGVLIHLQRSLQDHLKLENDE